MTRRWPVVLMVCLGPLLLALVWFEIERTRRENPAPPPVAEDVPGIVLYDVVERIRDPQGRVVWQLEAGAVGLADNGDYLISDLRHGQFFREGEREISFRADRAQLEAGTGNLSAGGDVRVIARRGVRLQAERVYWDEAEGRLLVPDPEGLEWRDPDDPAAEPALITADRLFYWPREDRLRLPDPFTAVYGQDTVSAAAGDIRQGEGRLQLAGPATVDSQARLEGEGSLEKRLTVSVGPGGELAYNTRTGAAQLQRDVTVVIPADQVTLTADEALYTGPETHTVKASGGLRLVDPLNTLTASRVVVDTEARRAEFSGPVDLTRLPQGGGQGLTLRAPRLTYWYTSGRRRAVATGGADVVVESARVRANRVDVNLETERSVMTGRVRLVYTPRPGEVDAEFNGPVTVTADRLEHVFAAGRRFTIATGSPRFSQGDQRGTARRLTFDHEREVLVLDGDVRLSNDDGERASAGKITLDLRRDLMTIERPVEAEIQVEDPG